MTLVEYINGLIQDGTWSSLSSEAQSIFLLIHAKYKGDPIKLSYRSIQESTGVSKSIVKGKLQELADAGLIHIDPVSKRIKPTEDLSNDGLPVPPDNPEQDNGEYVDLLAWVKQWVDSPWGEALGGIVLFYLIKLWLDYIKTQNSNSSTLQNHPNFIVEVSTHEFCFKKIVQKYGKNVKEIRLEDLMSSNL